MTARGRQTPTTSLVLPYARTKGQEAVNLYNLTGNKAQEWQKLLLYDIMGVGEDGLWTHVKFGYSVPRRNGKSEILAMRELWGLLNGEHIMHTAHLTTTSHSAWEKLSRWVEALGLPYTSIRALGRERITIPDTGGRIEYRTRTSKGGLGEGVDLLVIDEAQEYQDEQESALKYIVTDSKNPQTLFCGTPPTAVSSGTVFLKLRNSTLAGDNEDSGWAEWGVTAMTDVRNQEAWAETNPSLGVIFNERDIRAEIGEDKEDFNIQRLGLWSQHNLKSAITSKDWHNVQLSALPMLKGKLAVGIKFGKDGEYAAMSVAVEMADGGIFVEAIDCQPIRNGCGWMAEFLRKAEVGKLVMDGANGEAVLAKELKTYGVKKKLQALKTPEVIEANAGFEQAIFEGSVYHMGQPSLTQAATNCEKRAIGSNGGFGYRSQKVGVEIALLDSVILARWACEKMEKGSKKQVMNY